MKIVPASGLLALALSPLAAAQSLNAPLTQTRQRAPQAAKYGGVVHVASGTVTRRPTAVAAFGAADTIYACTAETPYFAPSVGPTGFASGGSVIDSGSIPGPTNAYATGATDWAPEVSGFAFAYCDLDTAPQASGWEFSFYEAATPCTSTAGLTPAATYALNGLNANGCWLFDIDLSGVEFCLGAEGGDGVFDDDPDFDSFAWSMRYIGSGNAAAGPYLASDPSATDASYVNPNGPNNGNAQAPAPAPTAASATRFNPLSNCTSAVTVGGPRETGSGFLSQDGDYVLLPGSPATSGCYYFGGYFNTAGVCGAAGGGGNRSYASFYMEIESQNSCAPVGPSSFCTPNAACAATANTSGQVGVCMGLVQSVGGVDEYVLRAENLPTSPTGVFGIFLHGLEDLSATPIAVGQGVLCIGEAGRFSAPGQIKQADANGVVELSTALGEWDINALPIASPPFTVPAVSGQVSYFGFWHRDFVMGGGAFNFTMMCGGAVLL